MGGGDGASCARTATRFTAGRAPITRASDAAKHESTPVHGVVLNLVVTIDTDSLVIELLKQQERLARTDESDRNELTIVCLKEHARRRKGDDFITPSRFLCCNAARLHADVAA